MRDTGSGAGTVSDDVYTLLRFGAMGTWSDERLIGQFLSGRDGNEAAFRMLLRRHGPMVLGVCRRVLGDTHLAEDAFQATFMVLVRKARTITDRTLLSNWLYGVAQRVARKVKAQAARRRVVERNAFERATETVGLKDHGHDELRSVIDEEIHRLPERYRAPVVLCYLEGLTHHEAARQLGCPVGTIESRLSRARERLRSSLTRRGLAPAATAMTALLAPTDASAAPALLVEATLRAATQLLSTRAGAGLTSTVSTALARSGLGQGSQLAPLAKFGLLVACAGLVTAGLGAYHTGGPPDPPPDDPPRPPAVVAAPQVKVVQLPDPAGTFRPEGPADGPRDPSATATPLAGISVDGRLDDWPKGLTRHPIARKLRVLSNYDRRESGVASDPRAYFMAGYDQKAGLIYLAVVVEDENLFPRFGDPTYTDAVEVYIDGLCSDRKILMPGGAWITGDLSAATMPALQYVAVPGRGAAFGDPRGDNPALMYGNIRETATRMSYRRLGTVTTYEWAIQAFDRFPTEPTRLEPGKRIGFDVAVVDKDREDAPPAWFCWGPSPRVFKGVDAGSLGELILGPAP